MGKKKSKKKLKKSIAIVGEGITEWCYFTYLRKDRRYSFKLAPELPKHSDFESIFLMAKRLIKSDYDLVFCVLDIDSIESNNQLELFKNSCKKLPKSIVPITSNPCTELWFFLHFMRYTSNRRYSNCEEVVRELRKYIKNYEKSKEFLKDRVFKVMEDEGRLERALVHASNLLENLEQKPENCSYSEVSNLINHLEMCGKCNFLEDCITCSRNALSVVFG